MSHDNLDLSQIPGLGPVRRRALAAAGIQDLRGLLALKVAELAEIQGIGLWQARKIREFLRQRGLLADEEEDATGAIHVHPPRTEEEARVVAAAAQALEVQVEREAATEAEVERLAAAVAQAMQLDPPAAPDAVSPERALLEEECEVLEQVTPAGAGEEPPRHEAASGTLQDQLFAQRERLPETAMTLMEAIRAASVSRRLTRQITRFLITASEFLGDARPLTDEQRSVAREAMAAVDALLNRAIERQRFRPDDQDELADRVRKYRKHLERVLGAVEDGDE
jgi:hypothetical protein